MCVIPIAFSGSSESPAWHEPIYNPLITWQQSFGTSLRCGIGGDGALDSSIPSSSFSPTPSMPCSLPFFFFPAHNSRQKNVPTEIQTWL
jgi:hypothetical protein